MQDFRKLIVWKRAHEVVMLVYQCSHRFPKREMYGITSQMRRAAASIPANIAEGCGRRGRAELAQFLAIAMGSSTELQYHLILARDLEMMAAEEYEAIDARVAEVQMMLASFISRLSATSASA
jgi:four helix bundle protein